MPERRVNIIGAGLAGSEAAWQLVTRGIPVTLIDMKPGRMSPAHSSPLFAELVCSNSLRGDRLENAPGLLKQELRQLNSLVLQAADASRVPAGGALAVDREQFSTFITEKLKQHPLVRYESRVVDSIPEAPFIIATGPLTDEKLAREIEQAAGMLHFYDAAAPIVFKESINMDIAFRASRYGRGDDYLNCPMNEDEYNAFIDALVAAECADILGFEDKRQFDGCLPIESIAKRGRMAAAFGPMKPVGLRDPRTGKEPFAVVQLRQDDAAGSIYNLVGFQTRLKFPEQKRVFGMIPGLEHAEFARFGVMHRNTFINSPGFLDRNYAVRGQDGQFFAGQVTGVEGYVESTASGCNAGIAMAAHLLSFPKVLFPPTTAMGALGIYISSPNRHFQPMNINFGILPPLDMRVKGKQNRYAHIAQRALTDLEAFKVSRPDLFN
ncbi:MAG: methylenetetrahydrofolate--tRNA-(uracil(54)-C(5))-methyltransferase (FADH(2)-oxidizing) TrmFO [Clostridiales bacterium]|nr:methylenetetrahydrofolate--tRNA-(uracil(54)-C(5))-methyltransferase (FADH(2)-oxidizing) TrmFO [Clostridiales bacterium]